ncbi:MAG: DUF1223 domain-containing protein [Casimicrobiaceae bacterium]
MKSRTSVLCAIAATSLLTLPVTTWAACEVQSGAKTAALVELYTSEGCSSCPPADKRLSHLDQVLFPSAEAVPLALHVGYWDYIGWHDPYAKDAFAERQKWLVQLNHQRTVYTPHFFVGGTELALQEDGLGAEVRRVNAKPAEAEIRVKASVDEGVLKVSADATARARSTPVALYLAVTESGLSSKVMRGENGGATLAHDHVVRAWVGPIRFSGGSVHAQREITLEPQWNRAQLDVVAFVEDQTSGAVLQAVNAGRCARS